jgi:ribosome-associated translation inhibitor RaiA
MAKRKQAINTRNQPLGVDVDSTPRAGRGRTTAPQTPVTIHADGIELPAALSELVKSKLGAKVGAFALQIDRVAVRFTDLNGPRGGNDCECRIQVVLAGRPNLVVAERAADPRSAFDAASQAVGRAVKRDLERAGFSQGLRAKHNKARREKHAPAPEAPVEAPAPTARAASRKAANRTPSALKLQKRANDQAHSPKALAEAARARRK